MGFLDWLTKPKARPQPIYKAGKIETPLNDFVVIDVETTGLNPAKDRIIQVSAVRYIDHSEAGFYSSYVNPGIHIPERITDITGIFDEMIVNHPRFDQIQDEFFQFVESSPLVAGYNVEFDLRFISTACGYSVLDSWYYMDVLKYARQLLPFLENHKLSTVSQYIGYQTQYHDSLCDCRACGAVLNFLCADEIEK